jgi:hypothetical protein
MGRVLPTEIPTLHHQCQHTSALRHRRWDFLVAARPCRRFLRTQISPTPVVGPHNNNIVTHFSPPATGLFSGKTNFPAPVSFDRRIALSPTAGPSSGRGSLSPAALSPNNSSNSLLAPVTGASNSSSTIFPSTDYRQGSTNDWRNNNNFSSSIQQQQTKQAKQMQKAPKSGHTPRRELEPPRRGREPPAQDAKARHKLGLGAGQAGGVSMEVDPVDPGNFLD